MSDSTKQYPGYFRGKQIRVRTTGPDLYTGILKQIDYYNHKALLVIEDSARTIVVNLDHVVSIEEKDQQ